MGLSTKGRAGPSFYKANLCLALTSTYQVIVEEDRPKKLKRELGGQECFPVPLTFDDAMSRGSVHYFGAELPASSLTEAKPFTVGDNQTYSGYWNPPLEPKKAYLIYFQAMSNLKGVSSRGTLLHLVIPVGLGRSPAGVQGGSQKKWDCFRSFFLKFPLWVLPQCPTQGELSALGHPYGALGSQMGVRFSPGTPGLCLATSWC